MARTVKAPEIRKLEIILCAKKLFESNGYEKTSVESIIKAAGIAKGTFYYYFKTKRDILAALVKHISTDIENHFQSIVESTSLSAIDKLKHMIRGDEKRQKSSKQVMAAIHNPENRQLQEQLNIMTIHVIAPLMAEVIEQGNQEGVFKAQTPLESVQLMLGASLFVLDSGLFKWSSTQRQNLLNAAQTSFEQSLGVQSGTLKFISDESHKI